MGDVILDALWLGVESKVRERDIDAVLSLAKEIGDRVSSGNVDVLGGELPLVNDGGESFPYVPGYKDKMPQGTTKKVKMFIEKENLFSRFLDDQGDSPFLPNHFRTWLDYHHRKDLDKVSIHWRGTINTLFKYYREPKSHFYKNIEIRPDKRYQLNK